MYALILAATHERALDASGREVPQPLLDLDGHPLLTVLVKRLSVLPDLKKICIVTNEAIRPALDAWREALGDQPVAVEVRGDGTMRPGDRKGAVGDLIFAIRTWNIQDALLVIGGDNWFTYDIGEFVSASRSQSPSVVVTPFGPGWRSQRFGVVQMDDNNVILRFLEKPESTTSNLKASCVYYFAAAPLPWLEKFAENHSTVCSPGVFLEWLVDQTAVFGVKMGAEWYDVSRVSSSALTGPDFLEFREILREFASPNHSTWERTAARQLQWASSHLDLLDALADPNPNRRIIAAEMLGQSGRLLSEQAKNQVLDALCGLLGDKTMNQIASDGYQMDEDTAFFVSATAAEALVRLGYAKNPQAVFQRAAQEGFEVTPTLNRL